MVACRQLRSTISERKETKKKERVCEIGFVMPTVEDMLERCCIQEAVLLVALAPPHLSKFEAIGALQIIEQLKKKMWARRMAMRSY